MSGSALAAFASRRADKERQPPTLGDCAVTAPSASALACRGQSAFAKSAVVVAAAATRQCDLRHRRAKFARHIHRRLLFQLLPYLSSFPLLAIQLA